MAIPKEKLLHFPPFPKGTENWQPKQRTDARIAQALDGKSAGPLLNKPREALTLQDVNKLLQDRKPLRRGVRIRDR